jgi:hypothetical protein
MQRSAPDARSGSVKRWAAVIAAASLALAGCSDSPTPEEQFQENLRAIDGAELETRLPDCDLYSMPSEREACRAENDRRRAAID